MRIKNETIIHFVSIPIAEIGHVQSLWASIDSEHSMTLHWKLNCVDEPITIGYNISYCVLDERNSDKCGSPMESFVEILGDDYQLSQYEIRDLKPYRLYNASISLMSRTHLGVPATAITVQTMEAGVLIDKLGLVTCLRAVCFRIN